MMWSQLLHDPKTNYGTSPKREITVFYIIVSQNLVKLFSQSCPGCVDDKYIFKLQLDVHFYKNDATILLHYLFDCS